MDQNLRSISWWFDFDPDPGIDQLLCGGVAGPLQADDSRDGAEGESPQVSARPGC